MPGPQGAEVTVVQSGYLGFIEALHDRKDGGVDEPHAGIGVTVTQFTHTGVVLGVQFLNAIGASNDIVQESHQNAGVEANVNPVVHFHQHGRWNDQRLSSFFKETAADYVIGVAPVKGSIQGTGIQY
jgi:hypothetical protein